MREKFKDFFVPGSVATI